MKRMEIEWTIGSDDVTRIKALLRKQSNNALVQVRRVRNLADMKPQVDRQQFWFQMVCMRLTSVQRSGPNSYVARFMRATPFPLPYEAICGASEPEVFIAKALKKSGGIRFGPKIAQHLTANFRLLEGGEWRHALQQCNRLTKPVSQAVEKEVAKYIQDNFHGFEPKQSRNFLQALGLTRYEIPIDSRVTDWLNEFGFPVRLSAAALADSNYYDFISEGVQALCKASGAFPCILDAAIFALKDGDAWTEANTIY
jgi:thermostable 8-oxoguanine DNA glycosylase